MQALRSGHVRANGVDFDYLEAGEGPLVLCLHGFPDNAHTFRYLLPVLARAGYRAVAPFMRGYAPTSPAPDGKYHAALLGTDVAALIPALGVERAAVVGHDWGAQATYGAAALAPERLTCIVTIAVAHPGVVQGDLALSYARIKGMWHSYFLQMPIAEQAISANDFAFLEEWWKDATEYDLPGEIIESVKATFRQPGVVAAALDYYRHTFGTAHRDPALDALQQRIRTTPVSVPALAFHGTKDRPGRLEGFAAMDHLFTGGLEKVVMPGTGHFLHVEEPEQVNQRIVAFLGRQGERSTRPVSASGERASSCSEALGEQ